MPPRCNNCAAFESKLPDLRPFERHSQPPGLYICIDVGHKVILNLKEVSSIDASGLATLAFCATRFHDLGGRLVLLGPGQPNAHVADVELNTVLENYQEETDAVTSFFPDRVVPRYDILEFVKDQSN